MKDLWPALTELEDILRSPIHVEDGGAGGGAGGALVSQLVSTLTRLCSALLLSPATDNKTANQFVSLLNICLGSDLFSAQQKQLFLSWKQKIRVLWCASFPYETAGIPKERRFDQPI